MIFSNSYTMRGTNVFLVKEIQNDYVSVCCCKKSWLFIFEINQSESSIFIKDQLSVLETFQSLFEKCLLIKLNFPRVTLQDKRKNST